MIQLKPSSIIAIIVLAIILILGGMYKIQSYRNGILQNQISEMNINVKTANENVIKVQSQMKELQSVINSQAQNRVEHTKTIVEVKEKVKTIEKAPTKEAETILNTTYNNIVRQINES